MSEKKKFRLSLPKFQPQDIVTLLFAAAVFLVNFGIVGECSNPIVYNDEMGYWTHAAEFAGLDWRGVSNSLAWYSYGYSFMLAPLMKLIPDTVLLYRASLVLNIVMQMLSYFMFVYILRNLFPKLEKLPASVAAAAGIFYTAYRLNAAIAFCETALLFVTTLTVFLLVRVINKPTCLNCGCLGLAAAYLFMVHNRTIGIVASAVLVMAAAMVFRKVNLRQGGVFAGVLAVGVIADKLIKSHLKSVLWESGASSGNDASSVFGKIKAAFSSVESVKRLLSILASQGFAISAATFCLALFAMWAMLRRISAETFGVIRKKKGSEIENGSYILLFIFCAFISTWIISGVFMFDFTRIDHVVYTRYFDIMVGVLIMTGICFLYNADKYDMGAMMLIPLIMKIGAKRAAITVQEASQQVLNKVTVPGICRLYDENGTNFHAYLSYSVTIFFILALVLYALKKHKLGIYVASFICMYAFNVNTPAAMIAVTKNQENYVSDSALIDRVKESGKKDVYVEPDTGTFACYLQYEMNDVRVDFYRDGMEMSEDSVIFINKSDIISYAGHEILDLSDKRVLVSGRKSESSGTELPLSMMNVFDAECYIADEDAIESNPENPYLCFGPYLRLDEGRYSFTLDMEFDDVFGVNEDTVSIGYAELRSNSSDTSFAHTELTSDMTDKNGVVSIELNADVKQAVNDMEIIVFLYDPKAVSMQLNSIEVNTED